jgi:hypothetical protein
LYVVQTVCCRAASTPVTVLRLHAGLRVEGRQLQERLHFLQGMLPVEHGMFFSLEGRPQDSVAQERICW